MSESKTSPKRKTFATSTVPDGEATPIVKGSHVYLVDGSGYIFRAFHALPPLTRPSDGLPVGAVHGFCAMLWKLLRESKASEAPTHIAVVFDAGRENFRNEIYEDYKANRPPPPDELIPQFPLIRDAVKAFNVACVEQEGFEADDLIATYAREVVDAGGDVTIVSSDKDLMQLIRPGIGMLDTMKNRTIGADEVRDMDATLGGVRKLGLRVLTAGGVPVAGEDRGGPRKTVMVRDWDGFVVEFVQGGAPVSGVTMYVSVQDLAQTVAFYNRVFGFDMPTPAAAQPAPDRIKAYFGDASLATMRSARGTFPGSDITLNFQEFGAPDRKAVRHRVQDPGGPILPVTVQDLPAVIEQVRAHGGTVGVGESSVTLAPDARSSWIRDPNGVLIQVSLPRPRN